MGFLTILSLQKYNVFSLTTTNHHNSAKKVTPKKKKNTMDLPSNAPLTSTHTMTIIMWTISTKTMSQMAKKQQRAQANDPI